MKKNLARRCLPDETTYRSPRDNEHKCEKTPERHRMNIGQSYGHKSSQMIQADIFFRINILRAVHDRLSMNPGLLIHANTTSSPSYSPRLLHTLLLLALRRLRLLQSLAM